MHGQLKIFIEVMRTNHNGEVVIRRAPVTTIHCSREDAYKNLEDWRTHNLKLSGQAFAEFHYMPDMM
jgi:hypothetical protein